jgi:formylglycine-generating enzyme required for sulfatase activity
MKRYGNLWEKVISFEALLRAAEQACKGKRFRPDVAAFSIASASRGRRPSSRVLRGGSFANQASNVRCANRNRNVPTNRNNNVGFRPASTWPCRNSQAIPCGACQGAKSRSWSRVGPSADGSAK